MSGKDSKWCLLDAEEAHNSAPETFSIPTNQERTNLTVGATVRLHFVPTVTSPVNAERIWVRIDRVSGNDYFGSLLSDPQAILSLSKGDEVKFQKQHVASILIGKEDTRWIDESKYALISNRVWKDKADVRFLYREAPDEDEDSGWRVFAGDEDDDYVSDAKNIQLASVEALLNLDATLESILNRPRFTALERTSKGEPFRQVEDFEFG